MGAEPTTGLEDEEEIGLDKITKGLPPLVKILCPGKMAPGVPAAPALDATPAAFAALIGVRWTTITEGRPAAEAAAPAAVPPAEELAARKVLCPGVKVL